MTTVGKELKKIRKMYGLSQAEMSAGVVTLPYYGGVERGTKKISIDSLLKILEKNGISIYEFFGAFDPKETHRRNLENRIQMAYLSGDIDELDSLLALDEIQADSLRSLQLQLVRSEISGGVKALPVSLQEKMRSELLHVGEWNRETLWELLITMPLFDQKEIAALMTSIINQETWHNSTIEILASVLIAYTKRLYKERNFSEARKIINVIKQMPTDPTLMLHKVLATYYSDLIDQNSRAEKIAKLLKMMNYQRFLEID